MKILISAFGFSPYRGSECAVGWNICNELAKMHDVTVLCGDVRGDCPTKQELTRYYIKEGHPSPRKLRIEYLAPNILISGLEKIHKIPGLWMFYYFAYNLWQRKTYKHAKNLHAKYSFDVVHQLNMIGYREPGYLWKLQAPFVWGPIGGAPNEPIAYYSMFNGMGRVRVVVRAMLNELQKRICIRAKRAARIAKKIWAVTDADYRMISGLWGVECEKMVETGTILRNDGRVRNWDGKSPLRIIWSGIHTSRKALPVLLYALSKVRNYDWQLDILGDGPENKSWKHLAETLGIAGRLLWHGMVAHDEALKIMDRGQVFAFPSLKEGTPHVVLEALSLGLPVICHDACGMGTVVTRDCGFKIPLKDPETSIWGFVEALQAIATEPGLIASKSLAAIERARELSWAAKARQISVAYERVVDGC